MSGASQHARVDAFVDAAFAFAVSLLVIAVGSEAPRGPEDFVAVLKRLPAFLAAFALIAMFWHAHVVWARQHGDRSGGTVLLSLALVFAVLVFVYPLRVMAASFMAFVSGGWLPADYRIDGVGDLRLFLVVYGVGYFSLAALMAGLYRSTLVRRRAAGGDVATPRAHLDIWLIQCGAALASLALAATGLPAAVLLAPWTYALLAVALPAYGWWSARRATAAATAAAQAASGTNGQ